MLSRVGPGQSLDGRPDSAGSGVGGPVGGTLSSGLKNIPIPQGSDTFVAVNENVFSVNLPGKITDTLIGPYTM